MTHMQSIVNKLNKEYKYTVKQVEKNPNMKDFKGSHWKVTFKKNGKSSTFNYSMGHGHSDFSDSNIAIGLISSLIMDSSFRDMDDMEGLGYGDEEGRRILKLIFLNNAKMRRVELNNFVSSLSKIEKESLE